MRELLHGYSLLSLGTLVVASLAAHLIGGLSLIALETGAPCGTRLGACTATLIGSAFASVAALRHGPAGLRWVLAALALLAVASCMLAPLFA